MSQLDETGDKDVVEEVPPALLPEPGPRRRRPSDKWDAMDPVQRIDALVDMEKKGMIPKGSVPNRESFLLQEEIESRYSRLHYDYQEKVNSYIRKNYDDLD